MNTTKYWKEDILTEKILTILAHQQIITNQGRDYVGEKDWALNEIKSLISQTLQQREVELREELKITENTTDGYHTFKELYEFRKLYNALLFNEWAKSGKYAVHKSIKHHDGEECFGGGWFIVVATLPKGDISNHYEMKDWDLFNCEIREKSKEWDGHSSKDVRDRLSDLLHIMELEG